MRRLLKTKPLSYARRALGSITVLFILLHSGAAFAQQLTFFVDEIQGVGLSPSTIDDFRTMFLGENVELQLFSSGDVVRIRGAMVPIEGGLSICNLLRTEGLPFLTHTLIYECSVGERASQIGIRVGLSVKRIGRFIRSASYSVIRIDEANHILGVTTFTLKRE